MSISNFIILSILAICANFSVALGQPGTGERQESPCQVKYGAYPIDFEGQKCWLFYALKESLFVYGDKLNTDGVKYNSKSIKEKEIEEYFRFDRGLNNCFLSKNYTAWGGNWYACRNGGISYRFRGDNNDYPSTETLNWRKLKNMSKEEIFKLSPAEKLDLYLNDSTFGVTIFELKHRGPERPDRRDDGFCGFCNGA